MTNLRQVEPEEFWPLAVAAILTIVWIAIAALLHWAEQPFAILPDQKNSILSAIVGLGGSLAGFVIAAKAVLLAVSHNKHVAKVKDMGGISRLLSYMRTSVRSAIALLFVGFVLMFCPDFESASTYSTVAIALAVFCFSLALGHVYRVASTMTSFVELSMESSDRA